MRTYLAFALLAAGLLLEPLGAFGVVQHLWLVLFAAGLAVLATMPAMRRGLLPALLVVVALAPFGGGGVGVGEGGSEGGSSWRYRIVGEVQVPWELGEAGVALLSSLALSGTILAAALAISAAAPPMMEAVAMHL